MGKDQTNLASEFYVLSVLHRLGLDASLSLGNKKSVDITVVRKAGDAITIDVKGVAGAHDWPADNISSAHPERHFVVLVSYEGEFATPERLPNVWVVPYPALPSFLRNYKGRRNVSRAAVNAGGSQFKAAWHLLVGDSAV